MGGDHYAKHEMQPIDIIDAYDLNFYEGNALKYLLRYKDKNGVEDLKKAAHYIQMLIEREENREGLAAAKALAESILPPSKPAPYEAGWRITTYPTQDYSVQRDTYGQRP